MKKLLVTVVISALPMSGLFAADANFGTRLHPMILACESADCSVNFLQPPKDLLGPASKSDKGNAPVDPVQDGCQGLGCVKPVHPSPFSLMSADSASVTSKQPSRKKKQNQ
jgi:hypothetical protein